MRKLATLFVLGLCTLGGYTKARAVTTTNGYSITVTVTPAVSSINLSNSTVSTVGPVNAGAVVGAVSITTNPLGGGFAGPIILGGANASSFALTNGGMLPCNLVVGSSNLAAGTYSITLSATVSTSSGPSAPTGVVVTNLAPRSQN